MWYACCLLIKYCFLMFTHFSSFLLCQLHKLYIEINIYQVVKHLMPFFWKSVRSYTVADLTIFELKIICICPWNGQFSKACRFWPICLWICQFLLVKKISLAITFDQQGIEISYLACTIWHHFSEKVNEYIYDLFSLWYFRHIGLCSMDHMNNFIHV